MYIIYLFPKYLLVHRSVSMINDLFIYLITNVIAIIIKWRLRFLDHL